MKKTFSAIVFLSLSLQMLACFNPIAKVIPGVSYPAEPNAWELVKPNVDRVALRVFLSGKESGCDDLTCNDVVIAYCYNGELKKALELSARLVRKYPSRYEILMTHSAVLELNGRFEEALKFMRKGLRIDPHSHKDSEWIHVKILEARISGGTREGILGFDFGNGDEPDTPKGVVNVRQLVDQIHFQLKERYYFIPKNDPQFGALIHDYANLLYLSNFKTIARPYYDLAIVYGFDKAIRPNKSSLAPLPELKKEPAIVFKPKAKEQVAIFKKPEGMLSFFVTVLTLVALLHYRSGKRHKTR